MDKQLPVFRLTVTEKEDSEEIYTALVDAPAIESNFLMFKKVEFVSPNEGESKDDFMNRCIPILVGEGKDQDQAVAVCASYYDRKSEFKMQFEIQDNDRRIITGAVMIPDMMIYRKDDKIGEHYVYFTKDDIDLFIRKWAKGDRYNAVNEMHNRNSQPSGMFLIESFQSDNQRGIKSPACLKEEFPDGSWFHSYYVENDELWAKIKSGEYKGFSMEMMVDYVFAKQIKVDPIADLMAILNNITS